MVNCFDQEPYHWKLGSSTGSGSGEWIRDAGVVNGMISDDWLRKVQGTSARPSIGMIPWQEEEKCRVMTARDYMGNEFIIKTPEEDGVRFFGSAEVYYLCDQHKGFGPEARGCDDLEKCRYKEAFAVWAERKAARSGSVTEQGVRRTPRCSGGRVSYEGVTCYNCDTIGHALTDCPVPLAGVYRGRFRSWGMLIPKIIDNTVERESISRMRQEVNEAITGSGDAYSREQA